MGASSPHGRSAGVLGPTLVTYIREYQLAHGVPSAQAYNMTMYILAGLLLLGFACNLAVRPVLTAIYMPESDVAPGPVPAPSPVHR